MVKSWPGMRLAPRSSPTTLRPALVSSRARIDPVQPTPMTTASVSLSVIMTHPPSGKIRDRARRLVVFLAKVFFDVLAVGRGETRIADHLPRRHVAIAAIDRVGEKAFHAQIEQRVEEHAAGKAGKLRL